MHLCSAGGCIISFEKSNVQIVVYEAVSTRDVEVVLLRHGMALLDENELCSGSRQVSYSCYLRLVAIEGAIHPVG